MNKNKFKTKLFNILKEYDRLWNEDKTELNQILLLDLADNMDKKLIELLLNYPETKEKIFMEVSGSYVFKTKEFKFFIEENKVNNSYTRFANKIGLSEGDKLLKDKNEVVLNFPYKDCILQGGQQDEEGKVTYYEYDKDVTKTQKKKKGFDEESYNKKTTGREEIFFNQILAQDEIDRLFDRKALVNWTRVDQDGEHEIDNLFRDENGKIKENLLIKGNNLLVLQCLTSQFKNTINMIYIDVPYNTGSDEFKYNDKFNHSTWLTFIKNRLEIAKKLIRKDGLIFVHCDDNEQAYLKVLMDEIFGRNNFISTIITLTNRSGRDYGGIARTHDYILVYSKTSKYKIYKIENTNKKFPYIDDMGKFQLRGLRNRNVRFNIDNRPNLFYPFHVNPKSNENDLHEVSVVEKEDWIKVLPKKSQGIQTVWRWGKEKAESENYDLCARKRRDDSFRIMQKYRDNTSMARSVWYEKEIRNEVGTRHIKDLFDGKVFDYPKSEYLIKKIIEIGSKKDDIVLDFCLGSGTTSAVAHKMGRQYIGVEQMDYFDNVTIGRMKKVIEGEQGGISKEVNWKGGGNFIYCELAKWNKKAIEEIIQCKSLSELKKLYNDLYYKYFLNYNFKIKQFKKEVLKEEFKALSLKEQKRMFLTMLDLNQMYVQKSEMEDERYHISKKDQEMTKMFYYLEG